MNEILAQTLADVLSEEQGFLDLGQEIQRDIVMFALAEGVSAILYHQIKKNDFDVENIPLYEVLRERTQLQYITYLKRMYALQETVDVFEKERIPFIFFKGFSVAHQVYNRPYLRMMSDVDVLIHQGDRERSISLLQKMAYQLISPRLGYENPLTWKYGHVYNLHKSSIDIDLHDKVYDTRGLLQLSDEQNEWLMAQYKSAKLVDQLEIMVLRPEIELLYVCVHALMHHLSTPSFKNMLDVYLICKSTNFSWEFTMMAAEKLDWKEPLYFMLKSTKIIFQNFIPEMVLKSLEDGYCSGSTTEYIARLRKLYNFRHAIRCVDRGDRFQFFFGLYILPSKQYIKEKYHVRKFLYYPYYYLIFMFERIEVFFQVRFGIKIRKN